MSHKRKVKDNQKLQKIYDERPVKKYRGRGVYFDEDKGRLVRYTYNNEWFKTHSRRVIRRKLATEDLLSKSNLHRKVYDYRWTVL